MIPQDVVDGIIHRVSLVELMSRSVVLKKSGRNYVGLCPFHNDRHNPSLSVSEEKGLYHCFSCGAGGNVLTFLKEHEKLDFVESMKVLAKMSGVDIEPYLKADNDLLPLRERIKTMHHEAQGYFHEQLYKPKGSLSLQAAEILRRRRIDKKTATLFGLGFGGVERDGLFHHLRSLGFKADEIVQSGLCGKSERHYYDRFARRITFPVWDDQGKAIAFGGRAIEDHARAKYINSPETLLFKKSSVLYAWSLAKENVLEKGMVLLAEGYMDVIRLFQAGFSYAVAPMGTGLSEDRIAYLKNKADILYFCFDGDSAGVKSAFRSSGLAAKLGVKAKVVLFPEEDDPDTFLLEQGADAFAVLLDQAQDSGDFVMDKARRLLPDTQSFCAMVFEYAFSLDGENADSVLGTETEAFLRRCAEEAKISFASIEKSFWKFQTQMQRGSHLVHHVNVVSEQSEERKLAGALIMFPELADRVAEILAPTDFSDEESREVYRQILLHPEKESREWLSYWGTSSLITEAATLAEEPDLRLIKDYALQIRIKSLGNEIEKEMQNLMSSEQDVKTLMRIKELQREKIDLKENFYKL